MNIFLYTFLFIFGTMFGSFASVLIYRIRSGEGGIINGRSHCKTCERDISAGELVPIFSWLFQGGKCKGCKQSISVIYPLLEIATGILFMLVGIFLISPDLIFAGNILEWGKMIFFCTIMFLTIVYVFYDILYLEIPESILLGANIIVILALIAQGYGYSIIPFLPVGDLGLIEILLCFIIIGGLYSIMLAGFKTIWDLVILAGIVGCIAVYFIFYATYQYYAGNQIGFSALLSGSMAALGIFISFFVQIVLSAGRAMGAGDLRIAILMGLLVGVGFAFQAWMICYLVGSVVGIIIILKSKLKNGWKSGFQHQIPFGPFIASGYLCVLFFHTYILKFIEWYL